MKNFNFIILLVAGLLTFGCASAKKEDVNSKIKTEVDVKETSKVLPEHLTFESFKEKVWDFEANPQEWIYKGNEPCIIDFYADWCKPCKMVAPIMEELANDYDGKLKIYKIDTQTERKLASVFQISGIPAILFVPAEGQPMKQTGAMSKDYYEKVINDFLLSTPKSGNAASQK